MNENIKKYSTILKDLVLNTEPKEREVVSAEFAKILFENGLSLQVGMIIEEARRLAFADIDRRKVVIKSAKKLSDLENREVKSKIEEKFGKNLIFKEIVDDSLIAGVIVETEGVKIDGSLAGRINNLSQHLK